jgi:NAD(P)-dependent dehydrogenase (short-subunit alcohol dehydrogenase family)
MSAVVRRRVNYLTTVVALYLEQVRTGHATPFDAAEAIHDVCEKESTEFLKAVLALAAGRVSLSMLIPWADKLKWAGQIADELSPPDYDPLPNPEAEQLVGQLFALADIGKAQVDAIRADVTIPQEAQTAIAVAATRKLTNDLDNIINIARLNSSSSQSSNKKEDPASMTD